MLLADLGSLRVTSDMQFNIPDFRVRIIPTRNTFITWEVFVPSYHSLSLSSSLAPQDVSLADLQKASYHHFNVSLTAVQLILAGAGDDWQSARREASSPYHILHPLGFDIQLKKSSLPNDTNLPRYKHVFFNLCVVLIVQVRFKLDDGRFFQGDAFTPSLSSRLSLSLIPLNLPSTLPRH